MHDRKCSRECPQLPPTSSFLSFFKLFPEDELLSQHFSPVSGLWGKDGGVRGWQCRPAALAACVHGCDKGTMPCLHRGWGAAPQESSKAQGDHQENPFAEIFERGNCTNKWLSQANVFCPGGVPAKSRAWDSVWSCYSRWSWPTWTSKWPSDTGRFISSQ